MKRFVITSATVAFIAGLGLAPALAQESAAELAEMRSAQYKAASAEMKSINTALKARTVNADSIQASATKIADALEKASTGYKDGLADQDTSDAKKSVWTEQEKFSAMFKESIDAARDLAAQETKTAMTQSLQKLGETCGTCHKEYRK